MTEYLQFHLYNNLSLSLSLSDSQDKNKSFIDSLHIKWLITYLHSRNGKAKVSIYRFRKTDFLLLLQQDLEGGKVADKVFVASTNVSP